MLLTATIATGLITGHAYGAKIATVRSPEGTVRATVTQDRKGALALVASLRGERIIAGSPLGLELADGDLSAGLAVTGVRRAAVDRRFRTPSGSRRRHELHARDLTVSIRGARRFRIRVRVADDGVAYRYEIPGSGAATVSGERSGFRVAGPGRTVTAPYTPNGEALWGGPSERTALAQPGEVLIPALVRQAGENRWALLTETGVDGRYAGSHLRADQARPGEFDYVLARHSDTTPVGPIETGDPVPVEVTLPFTSPWRLAVVGSAADVATSDLPVTLGRPPRDPGRFDWVKPGLAAWSWLTDNDSPADLERQRRFVDFAAAHRWRYVIVDAGWRSVSDGVPALVRYAKRRGVGILLWCDKRELDTAAERRSELARFASWGVAGLKVDFFDDETQPTMALADRLAAAAARRQMVLSLHGFGVPRGLTRTWPNVLTVEAARGAEYYDLAQRFPGVVPAPGPEHNATLPFTRQVMGPMDLTPVTFTAPDRITGDAHELALAVVTQSGILVPADRIEAYRARPNATWMLDRLPPAWRAIRLIRGSPGRGATVARRAAPGEWWIGSINGGASRRLSVPLHFLGPGRWRATIATEAPGPDVALARRRVRAHSRLVLGERRHGGSVVRLRRLPTE